MPFLQSLKTKVRTAFEEKKEQARTSLQKFKEAKPQEARTLTGRDVRPAKGMFSGGLFVGNGAALSGQIPRKKKKAKKSKAAITIQLEGKTLKVSTGTKAKAKKRRQPSANIDIMNIEGGILG